MGLGNYNGGAAQTASGALSNVQGALNGNPSTLSFLSQKTGLSFLKPKGLQGIAGYVFSYVGNEDLEARADITDHWLENNTATQDHAAVYPVRFTMSGFICELTLPNPGKSGVVGVLNSLTQKMGGVSAYLGKYTPGGLQKITNAVNGAAQKATKYVNEVNQYLNQAQNVLGFFKSASGAKTQQQDAYASLITALQNRLTFSVVTPWTTLQNVMLESVNLSQPDYTNSKSEISVTVKQLQIVPTNPKTPTPAKVLNNSQGRAAFQGQPISLNGSTPMTPTASFVNNSNPLNLPIYGGS